MKNKRLIVALIGICTFMYGCRNAEEKKAMGPEDVVEAFSKALASGDFENARCLCDSIAMKDYIEGYAEVWNRLQKEDSSALAIAASLLSEAEMSIIRSEKTGDGKDVYYRIEADGNVRELKATVKKEEGEWKVKMITDAL